MDHHIDRRIILNQDTEFKNLYKWCLQELDADDKKVGRDKIPWDWNLYFTATELKFSDSITIEPNNRGVDDGAKTVVRETQFIKATLRPGDPQEQDHYSKTTYSMFGTDRTISAFELFIEKLESEDRQEHCSVWGSVSYTMDIDFGDETTDDIVIFYLYVSPATFDRYAKAVSASEVHKAVLSVRQVEGFYSDWSPSISTNDIKVLTIDKEQAVEMPENCEIIPPRLGEIGAASFSLLCVTKLETATHETADDADWLEDDAASDDQPDSTRQSAQRLANENARAVSLLTSLRTATWVIAVLLFLILVT